MLAPRPIFTARRLGLAAAAVAALIQFMLLARLIGPGLVSSYPGIEYDGFDWVLEGLYLRALVQGVAGPPLLCLRSPVFVLVTALDACFGSSGLVVVGVLCLAQGVSLATLLSIWRRLGLSGVAQAALFILAALSPYAFFQSLILADPLAIAAMLVSTRLLLEWFITDDERWFRAGAAAGLLAGLTQLYGILPFVTGACLSWVQDRRAGRSGWSRVFCTTAALGLGGLLLALWHGAIPHEHVPVQFPLLRLSLDMAGFYANVWMWYFGSLVPVFLVLAAAALRWRCPVFSPASRFLAAATGLLVGLLFFYQCEEARFSWYYFHLVLCLVACGLVWLKKVGWGRPGLAALAVSLVLVVVQALVVTPGDFWQPKVRELQWEPQESWAAQLVNARPVDRLDLAGQCGAAGVYCEKARLPSDIEPDEQRLLQDSIRLRLLPGTK